MAIPRVCRWCSNYVNGVCTADIYELTDEEGYDYSPGGDLKYAVDMGEIREVLESAISNQNLISELDSLLTVKLNNLADEFTPPNIKIKNPDTFGCSLWR